MTPEEARKQTEQHINRVSELLSICSDEIEARGRAHDASKLEEPEASIFEANTAKLSGLTYGSEEYKAALSSMSEAVDHHYENNRHHPEHWPNGIEDMNLVDLLEMAADWYAATERHNDGDILKSIEHNTGRFGLSEQIAQVLRNTVGLFE